LESRRQTGKKISDDFVLAFVLVIYFMTQYTVTANTVGFLKIRYRGFDLSPEFVPPSSQLFTVERTCCQYRQQLTTTEIDR
jgi:hypothetical protein